MKRSKKSVKKAVFALMGVGVIALIGLVIHMVLFTQAIIEPSKVDDLAILKQESITSFTPSHTTLLSQGEINNSKDNNQLFKSGNSESSITRIFKFDQGITQEQVVSALLAQAKSEGWSIVESQSNLPNSETVYRLDKALADQDKNKKHSSLLINRSPNESDSIVVVFTIY